MQNKWRGYTRSMYIVPHVMSHPCIWLPSSHMTYVEQMKRPKRKESYGEVIATALYVYEIRSLSSMESRASLQIVGSC